MSEIKLIFVIISQLDTFVVPMACGQRMCRYCRDTLQVHLTSMDGGNAKFCLEQNWPCELNENIHVFDGHGRIYNRLEKPNRLASE